MTGTALDHGATWYVTRDRLGWSTVVLAADDSGAPLPDLRPALRHSATLTAEPTQTALAVRDALGASASRVGFALVRVSPYGGLVELLNVSLPTVLVWHPIEGISPYEPAHENLGALSPATSSEIVRLHEGGLVTLTTSGVLPSVASWPEIGGFVREIGIDPLGGTVAEAAPPEIARLLRGSWNGRPGPRAMVLIGQPAERAHVA